MVRDASALWRGHNHRRWCPGSLFFSFVRVVSRDRAFLAEMQPWSRNEAIMKICTGRTISAVSIAPPTPPRMRSDRRISVHLEPMSRHKEDKRKKKGRGWLKYWTPCNTRQGHQTHHTLPIGSTLRALPLESRSREKEGDQNGGHRLSRPNCQDRQGINKTNESCMYVVIM